jgi:formamidase
MHRRGWFDGAIGNNDSAQDILHAPFRVGHQPSGPIAVKGARPGDLLVVDIVAIGPITQDEIGPLPGQGWGYIGIFAPRNGGGLILGRAFPRCVRRSGSLSGAGPPPGTFPESCSMVPPIPD